VVWEGGGWRLEDLMNGCCSLERQAWFVNWAVPFDMSSAWACQCRICRPDDLNHKFVFESGASNFDKTTHC
jgi:hypothetical protein